VGSESASSWGRARSRDRLRAVIRDRSGEVLKWASFQADSVQSCKWRSGGVGSIIGAELAKLSVRHAGRPGAKMSEVAVAGWCRGPGRGWTDSPHVAIRQELNEFRPRDDDAGVPKLGA